ncbi:MAG: peptidylprolyl isomerase [Candidatus Yanofskybacteria bacterium]|nr:peptidylprolyl isomerase [Candidatus Yanofskybacteria bacterium]
MGTIKSIGVGVVLLAVVIGVAVWAQRSGENPEPSVSPSPTASVSTSTNNMHEVTISTNLGDIVFQTYDGDAPKAVANFIQLASKGFYDGVIFHRVIEGFMIQGGDPKGTGTGGPGYTFEDELDPNTESARKGYVRGTVAMANAGPNTNGSQFFIMHQDYPLPHNYTIFGHVVRGQDVVDAIATTKTDANDKPVTPVVMKKVTVAEVK